MRPAAPPKTRVRPQPPRQNADREHSEYGERDLDAVRPMRSGAAVIVHVKYRLDARMRDAPLEEVLQMSRLFQWLLPGLVTNIAYFRAQLEA